MSNLPKDIPWVKRIVLDFDGVVHQATSPFVAPEIIADEPVDYAFTAISEYIQAGYRVAIYSARSASVEGRQAILEWFIKKGMHPKVADHLEFPTHKPNADIYIDDKGYHFTGTFPTVEFIRDFRPWNKPTRAPFDKYLANP